MNNAEASREVLWNISNYYLMYPVFLICLGICLHGFYKQYRLIAAGKPDSSTRGDWLGRFTNTFLDVALHRKIFKSLLAGIFHISIFWSFMILLFATTMVALDMYLPWNIFKGRFYLGVSLLADLAGAFFTIGIGMTFVRRYIVKKNNFKSTWQDSVIHGAFFYLMASGFLLEGVRIAYAGDPWAAWTPFGWLMSVPFQWIPENIGRLFHLTNWWVHAFVTFGLIALIPYTKLRHMVTIPLNTFTASNRPRGCLDRIDLEKLMEESGDDDEFSIGVATYKDLTWKQRLEHDSCIECKRCDSVCPAHVTGHNLSPMNIMLSMRDMDKGDADKEIVGTAVAAESLWECRTCYACVEACPAGIDQLGQIIDMRRSEVLMKGEMPAEGQTLLRDMESRGNPFGPQEDRLAWIEKEGFKVLKEDDKVEVLYWIGCATSFDPRKQKVARDMVKIFEQAGVSYAVLGEKESCNGDPARVVGDENIFQMVAKEQATKINPKQFDVMVANCPHCYNAFDNEYPQFGLKMKVLHHTEFINKLIAEGRLKLDSQSDRNVAFHDPCYLGRV